MKGGILCAVVDVVVDAGVVAVVVDAVGKCI